MAAEFDGLPPYDAGARTYEDELLARWCFYVDMADERMWKFHLGGGGWYGREAALSIIRACLGLGVDPANNVSALALAAVYARIERLERRSSRIVG